MPRYADNDDNSDFYCESDLPMPDLQFADPQGQGGFRDVGHATFATGDRIYSDDGSAITRVKGNGNASGIGGGADGGTP